MAKEKEIVTETNKETALQILKEEMESMKQQMQLMTILQTKQMTAAAEEAESAFKKVIQVNVGKKGKKKVKKYNNRGGFIRYEEIDIIIWEDKYFFNNVEEQHKFLNSIPGKETETFKIELMNSTADKHLEETRKKLEGKANA